MDINKMLTNLNKTTTNYQYDFEGFARNLKYDGGYAGQCDDCIECDVKNYLVEDEQ